MCCDWMKCIETMGAMVCPASDRVRAVSQYFIFPFFLKTEEQTFNVDTICIACSIF